MLSGLGCNRTWPWDRSIHRTKCATAGENWSSFSSAYSILLQICLVPSRYFSGSLLQGSCLQTICRLRSSSYIKVCRCCSRPNRSLWCTAELKTGSGSWTGPHNNMLNSISLQDGLWSILQVEDKSGRTCAYDHKSRFSSFPTQEHSASCVQNM